MDGAEEAIDDVHTDEVRDLVGAVREEFGDAVRLVFRYEGDRYDVVHVREDVDRQYTDAELEERIETLMMKGLGDPPQEGPLYDYGRLEATVRWFEGAVVAYFPDEEWSGAIVVLDRRDSTLVDLTLEYLD